MLFFFFIDGRLWVASSDGVRCVLCSGGGLVMMMVSVNVVVVVEQKE